MSVLKYQGYIPPKKKNRRLLMKLQKKNKIKSDNEYKLDLENNKYKLDSGTVEIEATYSSITSMKIIQYAFGGGDV